MVARLFSYSKLSFPLLLFLILLLGLGGNAYAHATPISYEPDNSSILQKAPERVRIHFSERIEPTASGISVLGPDGSHAETRSARTDPADAHFYQVDMKDAGAGTYTVVWQVVSADDGHFTKGAFVFSVGKETAVRNGAAGQIQIQHITTLPEAGTIWLELFGQSLLLGALLMLAGIWRPLRQRFKSEVSPESSSLIERRIAIMMIAGVVFVIAGVISVLVLKTLDLEQLRGTDFITTLRVFAGTLDGSHAVFRGALAVVFGFALWFRQRRVFDHKRTRPTEESSGRISKEEKIMAVLVFLMALSRSRVSHSAATNFYPWLSVLITTSHLLSKEIWIGGLMALNVALLPALKKIGNLLPAAFSFSSFSRLISAVFAVTGITGCYLVWLDLKDPAYLFSTEWGARFIMLALLGGALFLIRLYQQLMVDKAAVALCRDNTGGRSRQIISRSPYTLALEMWVGIMLLFVTSLLIITTPPFPPERFSFERHAVDQGARIDLVMHPHEPEYFLVTVTDAAAHTPLPLSGIVVKLTNQEQGIGPIVAQTKERFPGGYVFSRNTLSLPGKWHIAILAQRPRAFDETTSFEVDYPKEIDASRVDPERRSFGWFEALLLIIAAGMGVAATILYRISANLNLTCAAMPEKDGKLSPILSPNLFKSWSIGIAGTIVILAGIWFSYGAFMESDFQKICERDNGFWLQSVPMADGVALSSDTVTGCTLNLGLYHFVDEREYAYFVRPRQSAVLVATIPKALLTGTSTQFTVTISDIVQGKIAGPIQDLGIYHDRILHMIIIGEDLKTFAHIHTEDLAPVTPEMKKEGKFPLRYTFTKAGHYTVVVNYIQGGRELSQQSFLEVGGDPKMEKYAPPTDASDQQTAGDFNGYRVTLQKPDTIKAGDLQKLTYVVEKDGKPMTDLEPYLGAAMHLAIVRHDLGRIIHTHGQVYLPGSAFFQQLFQNYVNYHSHFVPDHFGPKIQARITFPQPGLYQLFGEFKVQGKVVVTSFIVKVQ